MVVFPNSGRFERITIAQGDSYTIESKQREVVVVLLSGSINAGQNPDRFIISRNDVFSAPAGFCLANQELMDVVGVTKAEFCIAEVESDSEITCKAFQAPDCIKTGEDNTTRDVCRLADSKDGLKNLIVGETINPPGNWSSWPPHKHDTHTADEESQQQEVYLYRFSDPSGFAVQMLNDDPQIVRENDTVKIESGYHPLVASPNSELYYLWVLYGDNSFFKVKYK